MTDNSRRVEREHVEALKASRKRLLIAADAARRKIERDLHAGVQQHLVALAVNLQLAGALTDSDPAAARALLEEWGATSSMRSTRRRSSRSGSIRRCSTRLISPLRCVQPPQRRGPRLRRLADGDSFPPEVAGDGYWCWLEVLDHTSPGRTRRSPCERRTEPSRSRSPRRATARAGLEHLAIASRRSAAALTIAVRAWPRHPRLRLASTRAMTLGALREVEDHGLDPLVHRRLPRQPELQEDRVDHLLDRPSRSGQSASAIAALFLPSAISRSTSRSRGVSWPSGDSSPRAVSATSASTTLGSITEPPAATARIAPASCSRSVDTLLEEIARAARCRPPGARARTSGSRTG